MTGPRETCELCGAEACIVEMDEAAWGAVSRCLGQGSPTLAGAELVSLSLIHQANAKDCIEHLRHCVFSWPIDASMQLAIAQIDEAFLPTPKPKHFTNFNHCDECRAHDDTLRSKSVQSISRRDLGNQGWDPIGFCNPEGLAYYLPALARLAIIPDLSEDQDLYVEMLIPHLNSSFREHCSSKQRTAVACFLDGLGESEMWRGIFTTTATRWSKRAETWRTAAHDG